MAASYAYAHIPVTHPVSQSFSTPNGLAVHARKGKGLGLRLGLTTISFDKGWLTWAGGSVAGCCFWNPIDHMLWTVTTMLCWCYNPGNSGLSSTTACYSTITILPPFPIAWNCKRKIVHLQSYWTSALCWQCALNRLPEGGTLFWHCLGETVWTKVVDAWMILNTEHTV